jgi:DNA gyrase/topoisomerase IV subunit A
LDEVVVQEMEEVKKDFGDARRTELSEDLSVFELNASIKKLKMIEERRKEDVILWIGNDYSVKILYQSRINSIPEESLDIIYTHNQDRLIVITDKGELVIERLKDFGSHQMKQK